MFWFQWTSKFQWSCALICYFEGLDWDGGGAFLYSHKENSFKRSFLVSLIRAQTAMQELSSSPGHLQMRILALHFINRFSSCLQARYPFTPSHFPQKRAYLFWCLAVLSVWVLCSHHQWSSHSFSASLPWYFLPGSHPIAESPFLCGTGTEGLCSDVALKRKKTFPTKSRAWNLKVAKEKLQKNGTNKLEIEQLFNLIPFLTSISLTYLTSVLLLTGLSVSLVVLWAEGKESWEQTPGTYAKGQNKLQSSPGLWLIQCALSLRTVLAPQEHKTEE